MAVLLFLHVALMFAAVAMAAGTLALLALASRTQRLAELGPVVAALPIARVTPPLFVLGGLAGLATAVAFGYPLLSPWLVIAYVLFAALFGLGFFENKPFGAKLAVLMKDQPPFGPIEGELRAHFSNPRTVWLVGLDYVLVVLVVFDMVVKPFS